MSTSPLVPLAIAAALAVTSMTGATAAALEQDQAMTTADDAAQVATVVLHVSGMT
jgi:hypothetical protein